MINIKRYAEIVNAYEAKIRLCKANRGAFRTNLENRVRYLQDDIKDAYLEYEDTVAKEVVKQAEVENDKNMFVKRYKLRNCKTCHTKFATEGAGLYCDSCKERQGSYKVKPDKDEEKSLSKSIRKDAKKIMECSTECLLDELGDID